MSNLQNDQNMQIANVDMIYKYESSLVGNDQDGNVGFD